MYICNAIVPTRDIGPMPGVSLFLSGFSIWLSSSVFPSLWILFPQRSVFSLWLKEIHAGHAAKHLGPCSILLWPVGLPLSCVVIVGMRGGLPWSCWSWEWNSEAWKAYPGEVPCLKHPSELCHGVPVPSRAALRKRERSMPVLLEPSLLMVSFTLKQPFMVYKTRLHPWPDASQPRSSAARHVLNFQCMGLWNRRGHLWRECLLILTSGYPGRTQIHPVWG